MDDHFMVYCVNLKDRRFEYLDSSPSKHFLDRFRRVGELVVQYATSYIQHIMPGKYDFDNDFKWRRITIPYDDFTSAGIICLNYCEEWEGVATKMMREKWSSPTYIYNRKINAMLTLLNGSRNLMIEQLRMNVSFSEELLLSLGSSSTGFSLDK
ncbi:unnamed protein product [Linum trigynum]|uniref:Ubiquitin-like protease family profile domain-containing protein n=1 Tax=Linum trigynum TaxID=586398 RepID=A0AAV2FUB6_9ROSI